MDSYSKSGTFRLFRKMPSFWDGFAAMVDMTPNMARYQQDDSAQEADAKSLKSDWQAVGNDLRETLQRYERKHA